MVREFWGLAKVAPAVCPPLYWSPRVMSTVRLGARPRARHLINAGLVAVLTASLLAPQSAFAAPTASPAAGAERAMQASTATVAQMTQWVYDQTNQLRYDKGLNGLARDTRLDKVAMAWALQQWKNGYMSHNPYYAQQIPSGWTRAGENVARGYTFLQVVPAWAASTGHYLNMVGNYTSIGIGYYEADGKRYWVQVFANYPGTTVPKKPTKPERRLTAHVPTWTTFLR
jgi:uncharacterized protein YkwD